MKENNAVDKLVVIGRLSLFNTISFFLLVAVFCVAVLSLIRFAKEKKPYHSITTTNKDVVDVFGVFLKAERLVGAGRKGTEISFFP